LESLASGREGETLIQANHLDGRPVLATSHDRGGDFKALL
jgi:hypothetical protein